MNLAELAESAGLPARTVRFYIARGLLDGPDVGGRAAKYTESHLERLREVQRLQQEGLTLSEIERRLAGPAELEAPAEPHWVFRLGDEVQVMVRGGLSPWRQRQVRNAVTEMFARLKKEPEKDTE